MVLRSVSDICSASPPWGSPFALWLRRTPNTLWYAPSPRPGREPMELTDQVRDVRPHADPAALAQHSEDRRQLLAAVQRLTPEQQQVITMRFIDNLGVDEIARLMRRRVGAIHSMQHRALASLYRFLLEPGQVEARRA